jgi:hypothetical protein
MAGHVQVQHGGGFHVLGGEGFPVHRRRLVDHGQGHPPIAQNLRGAFPYPHQGGVGEDECRARFPAHHHDILVIIRPRRRRRAFLATGCPRSRLGFEDKLSFSLSSPGFYHMPREIASSGRSTISESMGLSSSGFLNRRTKA